MHKFFMDQVEMSRDEIRIVGNDVNHIRNVLRLRTGERIMVSNSNGTDYICEIEQLDTEFVRAKIVDIEKNAAELPARIVLFQGLPKSDKMEWILQKAVELGAAEIVPVITKRTVVKVDEKKADKKIARYQAICEAAAKQSGRGIIPTVSSYMTFKEALQAASQLEMVMIPYEEAEGIAYARKVIEEATDKKSIGIFIGPEGGFAKEEVELAQGIGAKVITLGNRILRTETAGMTVLSILMFQLEGRATE